MISIEPLMARLAARRPVFHSEADFQHELAIELRASDPELGLRLELPFGHAKGGRLDILIRKGGDQFALELKYLCRSAAVTIDGEIFRLKQQGAQDQRRYDVCRDIHRIEQFCEFEGASGGMLLLTNNPSYWQNRRNPNTADAAFDFADKGMITGTLDWGPRASKGTKKGREDPLAILGTYQVEWRDFADIGCKGGRFRYLYLPVVAPSVTLRAPD